ncbi:unnamed protein product [Calypogeia fissa]
MAKSAARPVTKRKLRSTGPPSPLPLPAAQPDSDSEVSDDLHLDDDDEVSEDELSENELSSGSDLAEGDEPHAEDGDSSGAEEDEKSGGNEESGGDEGLAFSDEEDSDPEEEIAKAVREFVGIESDSDGSDGENDGEDVDDDDDDDDEVNGEDEEGKGLGFSEGEDEAGSDGGEEDGGVTGENAAGVAKEEGEEGVKAVEESDSEDDGELAPRNTIGEVPLEWYKDEKHIGYDIEGKKITKKEKKDQLEAFLARSDNSKDWRKVFDEYNDEEIELTKDEIDMIRRLRQGRTPHKEVNPYELYVDWFEYEDKGHPLSSAPEPKRRFIPSKWEAKKVVKLVRAIRKGWISLDKPKEKPKYYLLWGDDLQATERTANGLAYIPAPKPKLPGHEESYNPPEEYIPTQEEINAYQLMYEEDRPKFIPRKYDALRKVPSYPEYIKEQFERCLDLYLCPRSRKRRINIDPESLIPKLPKPKDLQPFPTTCFLEYRGHTAAVSSLATSPCGEWLASGSQDGNICLWEVQTGRCRKIWKFGGVIHQIGWNPNPQMSILAIAVENSVVLVNAEVGLEEAEPMLSSLLTLTPKAPARENGMEDTPLATWTQHEEFKGLIVGHKHVVHSVSWHYKGDYFVTVNPDGNTRAVLVHQLSKQQTQNPFRKHHGRVVQVIFHPSRPFMFVATKMHVRVYNLVKQQLSKKLMTGLDAISSIAIHSGGDNLIVGSRDAKLCWFDMDLSTKPYKSIKNHSQDIRAVAYHKTYPLFATCSEDKTAHVFHGMVYSDLLQNPLIVPVKVLQGHQGAIFDCIFHPKQPWLFTAGADAVIKLYCN